MKEEDAEILFKTKIDWSAIYSDNKIYCTEAGCDFVTEIKDNDEDLKSHLRTVHNWGDWPCSDQNCGYIGHSQVIYSTVKQGVFILFGYKVFTNISEKSQFTSADAHKAFRKTVLE